jgi:hypothetical protein
MLVTRHANRLRPGASQGGEREVSKRKARRARAAQARQVRRGRLETIPEDAPWQPSRPWRPAPAWETSHLLPPRGGAAPSQAVAPADPARGLLVGFAATAAFLVVVRELNGRALPCNAGVAMGLLWGGTVVGGIVGSLGPGQGERPARPSCPDDLV